MIIIKSKFIKKFFFCIIFGGLIILYPRLVIGSDPIVITPENFEWMSKTSVNIMRTFNYYNAYLEEFVPHLFTEGNFVVGKDRHIIKTTLGDLNVSIASLEAMTSINGHSPKDKSRYLGLLGVVNALELNVISNEPKYSQPTSPSSWSSVNAIFGLRIGHNKNIKGTLGFTVIETPYSVLTQDGSRLFSLYDPKDPDNIIYQCGTQLIYNSCNNYDSQVRKYKFFINSNVYGYDVGTIFEVDKFTLLEGLKEIFREKFGILDLGLNYYDYLNTIQSGFNYNYSISSEYISLNLALDSFINIRKGVKWLKISYVLPTMSLYLFKNIRKNELKEESDNEKENNKFYILSKSGLSYSEDIFSEGVFGYSTEVSLNNIPVGWIPILKWIMEYWNLDFGYSYNYQEKLYRIPIKDEKLIYFKFDSFIP